MLNPNVEYIDDAFYFLPNPMEKDLQSYDFTIVELEVLKEDLETITSYREKLLKVFSYSAELLMPKVMRSFGEEILFDVYPRTLDEVTIYNLTLRDYLQKAKGNPEAGLYKARFRSFGDFVRNYEIQRQSGDLETIINRDLEEIKKEYSTSQISNSSRTINFNKAPSHGEVFQHLLAGRAINYQRQFITLKQHLMILQCEEVRKYFNFLVDEKKTLSVLNEKEQIKKAENNQISDLVSAPVKALFCYIIDQTVDPRKHEGAEKYCERICKRYGLKYQKRVRIEFGKIRMLKPELKDEHLSKIKEIILPRIPEQNIHYELLHYIDNNTSSTELYA